MRPWTATRHLSVISRHLCSLHHRRRHLVRNGMQADQLLDAIPRLFDGSQASEAASGAAISAAVAALKVNVIMTLENSPAIVGLDRVRRH